MVLIKRVAQVKKKQLLTTRKGKYGTVAKPVNDFNERSKLVDLVSQFIDNEVVQLIVEQTNLYAIKSLGFAKMQMNK